MKKIIALLLAATMLLGMITAFAEDEAKEITWQDIPWGSSFDGVHQIMTDKGIYNPSSTTVMQGKHANSIMSGLAGAFLLENGDIEEEWYSDKYIKSEIRHLVYFAPEVVAGGYNVKTLIFTFSPDDKLMTIVVGIDTNDFWSGPAEDLSTKLKTVYGASDNENRYLKLGENNTAVTLGSTPMATGIIYGKTNWNEVLPGESENVVDVTDTSGL